MEYGHEVLKAIYLLVRLYILWLTFTAARHLAKESKSASWKAYLWTFVVIIGLTLFSSYTLGTHVEDSDPIYGGGETITDYDLTDQQRIKHGIFIFTAFVIPALIGTYKGLLEKERLKLTDGATQLYQT